MQELQVPELHSLLDNNQVTPYNIYGLDIDYQQFYSIDYYIKNQEDNFDKDQKLSILFFDIEIYTANVGEFPKPIAAKYPISAITIYNNFERTFKSYFLLQRININKFPSKEDLADLELKFKKELINEKYIDEKDNLQIQIFTSEIEMIRTCWAEVRNIDPSVLSGWSSDRFDLPYIYFRLSNLLNKNESEIGKILSRFGSVKIHKMGGDDVFIQIPEMPISDLMTLYKPRAEGGSNYGETLSSYSLDFVAEYELGLKKKEYKDEGMSLDTFYETDPVNFLLYNIIDVALTVKLNRKLRHIEAHNLLRRLMKTPFSKSLNGSAALFDTFVNYELKNTNQFVRFGIVEEGNISISEDELVDVYIPKGMKKTVKDISQQTFKSVTGRFPGAYVKDAKAQVLTSKDGIIIDLDASSLYPSMIIQSNISFDTLYGRIIDPLCYKFITVLDHFLKQKKKLPNQSLSIQTYTSLFEMAGKYTEKLSPQNKTEYLQYCYLIAGYLLKKVEICGKDLDQLFNPSSIEEYILLKRYFITLIDLFDDIHPNSKEYNSFCHDYLLNDEISKEFDYLYVIEDVLQPAINIKKIDIKSFADYLKEKNLMVTLSGCLFYRPEVKEGLFIEFLKNLKDLRNQYEKKRDTFDEDSDEYAFFDMRQNAIKITSNTTYGLFGMGTFRFSNKQLAKAITTQGRLTLKVAQIISDLYLNQLK